MIFSNILLTAANIKVDLWALIVIMSTKLCESCNFAFFRHFENQLRENKRIETSIKTKIITRNETLSTTAEATSIPTASFFLKLPTVSKPQSF